MRCWASSPRSTRRPPRHCRPSTSATTPGRERSSTRPRTCPDTCSRADPLLQDRDRSAVLVERAPARIRHDRRAHLRSVAGARRHRVPARRPGRTAHRPRGGRTPDGTCCSRSTGGRDDLGRADPAVAEHGDHQELDAARGGGRRRPGRAAGGGPLARSSGRGRHRAGRGHGPRRRPAGVLAVSRRVPHSCRPDEHGDRAGRQSRGHRRSRRARCARAGDGGRRTASRRSRPARRQGAGAGGSPSSCRTPGNVRCGSLSSRCTRCTAPTGR